jgi:hypothetical protein
MTALQTAPFEGQDFARTRSDGPGRRRSTRCSHRSGSAAKPRASATPTPQALAPRASKLLDKTASNVAARRAQVYRRAGSGRRRSPASAKSTAGLCRDRNVRPSKGRRAFR